MNIIRLLPIALISSLVLIGGCSSGFIALNPDAYLSPNGFEIMAPTDWTTDSQPGANAEVRFVSGDKAASIEEVTTPAQPGESVEASEPAIRQALSAKYTGWQVENSTKGNIRELPSLTLSGRGQQQGAGTLVWVRQITVIRPETGRVHTFILTAPYYTHTVYDPAFDEAMTSVFWHTKGEEPPATQ